MSEQSPCVDVLLLAAGFGKRLGELTKDKPKPLVEVGGKPLIDWNLELLAHHGIEQVVINLHYLGEKIREHVGDGSSWGLSVVYSEEPVLLDTGGAIKNIEPLLKHQNLLTFNSDIILGTDFPLREVLDAHESNQPKADVTMVLRHDLRAETFGSIGITSDGRVGEFLGIPYGDATISERLMYLGVQVLSRTALNDMPKRGDVFSITQDYYPKLLSRGGVINGVIYDGLWSDCGTRERIGAAEKQLSS
jgi:NDP-sugar pyrophosphorylase family protein